MKVFHCGHCGGLVFFENVQCVKCGQALALLPDTPEVSSLEKAGEGQWRTAPSTKATEGGPSFAEATEGRVYRLCRSYDRENVCNWAVAAEEGQEYCVACRLTRVIPDLTVGGNREAWYKLEVAKRRLVYGLLGLGLPVRSKEEDVCAAT